MKRKWLSVLLAAAMVTGSVTPASAVFADDDFSDADIVLEEGEQGETEDAEVETDVFDKEDSETEEADISDVSEAETDSDDSTEEIFTDEASSVADPFSDGTDEAATEFQSLGENQVALPDYIFGGTWNKQYDVLYHEKGKEYLYNGKTVEFPDENTVKVGDDTYEIRNRETEVTVVTDDTGKVTISLTNLAAGVYQIPGQWNASWGGKAYASYQTDISGNENVTFGDLTSSASTATLTLEGIAAGTYHLSGGVIYEKANQWSPGTDFGDGKGTVTAREFGYLPDITFTAGAKEEADEYLGVNAGSEVPDSFTNDLWTQYDFKEMKVGDSVKLIPRV